VDIAGVARRLFANLNREVVAGVFEFGQLKLWGRVRDFFEFKRGSGQVERVLKLL
jgi:hypothetical protein